MPAACWCGRASTMPGPDAPCLECGYDDTDYALARQEYACGGKPRRGVDHVPRASEQSRRE